MSQQVRHYLIGREKRSRLSIQSNDAKYGQVSVIQHFNGGQVTHAGQTQLPQRDPSLFWKMWQCRFVEDNGLLHFEKEMDL